MSDEMKAYAAQIRRGQWRVMAREDRADSTWRHVANAPSKVKAGEIVRRIQAGALPADAAREVNGF